MELTKEEFHQLQKGNPTIFKKLYLCYEKNIYNYLLVKTKGDKTVSNDVFSETFFSAYNSITKLNDSRNIQGWLMKIATRRLNDYLRKEYREKRKEQNVNKDDFIQRDVVNGLVQKEKKIMFDMALDHLKPDFKEVLKLKYYDDRSQQEIADIFKVKVTTIEGLLFRAKDALKKELKKIGSF